MVPAECLKLPDSGDIWRGWRKVHWYVKMSFLVLIHFPIKQQPRLTRVGTLQKTIQCRYYETKEQCFVFWQRLSNTCVRRIDNTVKVYSTCHCQCHSQWWWLWWCVWWWYGWSNVYLRHTSRDNEHLKGFFEFWSKTDLKLDLRHICWVEHFQMRGGGAY